MACPHLVTHRCYRYKTTSGTDDVDIESAANCRFAQSDRAIAAPRRTILLALVVLRPVEILLRIGVLRQERRERPAHAPPVQVELRLHLLLLRLELRDALLQLVDSLLILGLILNANIIAVQDDKPVEYLPISLQ